MGSMTHIAFVYIFQKLQEQLTKRSESLERDAVYLRTVSSLTRVPDRSTLTSIPLFSLKLAVCQRI